MSYTYDTLNRLIAAQAGSTWGQGFNYDPFGNLTTKYVLPGTTGSVPTLSVVPDAATNHLGGVDANGNATGYGINYDLENRLITASGAQYTYDGQNKRVFSCTNSCASETYYFYAPDGKLIAQFTPVYSAPYRVQNQIQLAPATLTLQNGPTRAYFGSRLLGNEDGLGSRGKYFPYGEDNGSQNPSNDSVKFATYTRDSATGLDYADQRYYANSTGRFLTPDPYAASARPANPQSWNRYTYVLGDPVNFADPSGHNSASLEFTQSGSCLYLSPFESTTSGCLGNVDNGAGGDPCSVGNSFGPNPDPFCYYAGPEAVTIKPPEPTCYIQLDWQTAGPEYIAIPGPGGGTYWIPNPAKHNSIFVVDRYGNTDRIEAHSDTEQPFGGKLQAIITNGASPQSGGIYPDVPIHTWWNSSNPGSVRFTDDLCDIVDAILNAAQSFSSGTIDYNLFGPNSNTFAYSVLVNAGGFSKIPTPPPISIGWGQPLP